MVDNRGKEIALVLNRKEIEKGEKPKEMSPNVKIERFSEEEELLKRVYASLMH